MTPLFFSYVLSNLTRIAELRKENLMERREKRASQVGKLFSSYFLTPSKTIIKLNVQAIPFSMDYRL